MTLHGMAGQARRVLARRGAARRCGAWQARQGKVWPVLERRFRAGLGRRGRARHVAAGQGLAWQARQGMAGMETAVSDTPLSHSVASFVTEGYCNG